MGVTADGQLALAFENMDDRRPRRRVLRKLLARGEGEEQELDGRDDQCLRERWSTSGDSMSILAADPSYFA
jgi:hypothetical protein